MKASASSERSKTSHRAGGPADKETTKNIASPPPRKAAAKPPSAKKIPSAKKSAVPKKSLADKPAAERSPPQGAAQHKAPAKVQTASRQVLKPSPDQAVLPATPPAAPPPAEIPLAAIVDAPVDAGAEQVAPAVPLARADAPQPLPAPANDPGTTLLASGPLAPVPSHPQEAKTRHVNSAEATDTVPAPTAPVAPAAPTMSIASPIRPMVPVRPLGKEEHFVEGDYVVYPTHGVGKVEKIAAENIAGHTLELIHITFEENRMTLRVPVAKARTAGLRKLATQAKFDEALAVLKGRARVKRTMWSRRAQEYEAKINSGDPIAIAEVVRDLHRNAGQPDQSFSERQIYESALDRLAAELAALDATDKETAVAKLGNYLKAA